MNEELRRTAEEFPGKVERYNRLHIDLIKAQAELEADADALAAEWITMNPTMSYEFKHGIYERLEGDELIYDVPACSSGCCGSEVRRIPLLAFTDNERFKAACAAAVEFDLEARAQAEERRQAKVREAELKMLQDLKDKYENEET